MTWTTPLIHKYVFFPPIEQLRSTECCFKSFVCDFVQAHFTEVLGRCKLGMGAMWLMSSGSFCFTIDIQAVLSRECVPSAVEGFIFLIFTPSINKVFSEQLPCPSDSVGAGKG